MLDIDNNLGDILKIKQLKSRTAIVAALSGLIGASMLSVSAIGGLGAFNATVTNNANTGTAGTIVLTEANSATTCLSTGHATAMVNNSQNCTPINLFANMTNVVPGATATSTTVTMKNVGNVNAGSFTLTPASTCTVSDSPNTTYFGSDTTGFCGKVDVTIQQGSTCIYPAAATGTACTAPTSTDTLATLAAKGPIALTTLTAGGSQTYTITTALDSSATNADQGLQAALPMSWELAQ